MSWSEHNENTLELRINSFVKQLNYHNPEKKTDLVKKHRPNLNEHSEQK